MRGRRREKKLVQIDAVVPSGVIPGNEVPVIVSNRCDQPDGDDRGKGRSPVVYSIANMEILT